MRHMFHYRATIVSSIMWHRTSGTSYLESIVRALLKSIEHLVVLLITYHRRGYIICALDSPDEALPRCKRCDSSIMKPVWTHYRPGFPVSGYWDHLIIQRTWPQPTTVCRHWTTDSTTEPSFYIVEPWATVEPHNQREGYLTRDHYKRD